MRVRKMSNPSKTYSSESRTPELKTDEKIMKNWAKTWWFKRVLHIFRMCTLFKEKLWHIKAIFFENGHHKRIYHIIYKVDN